MKRIYCLLAMILVFVSCQKEYDPGLVDTDDPSGSDTTSTSATLVGTWNFASLAAQTQSISTFNYYGINEQNISYADFISTNNSGTVTFTDSTISSSNIAYNFSTTISTYAYEDDVLTDSLIASYDYTIPPSSGSSSYQLIGTDSIYIPGDFIGITGADDVQIMPSGGRYAINGDTLTITQYLSLDTTSNVAGIIQQVNDSGKSIIKLVKQ